MFSVHQGENSLYGYIDRSMPSDKLDKRLGTQNKGSEGSLK